MEFTIYDSPDYYVMKVSVFDSNKKTDLIGETFIDLREIVIPGGGGDKIFIWHKLHYTGKYAGEIRIKTKYNDTKPNQESGSESLNRLIVDPKKEISPAPFGKQQRLEPQKTTPESQTEVQRQEEASPSSESQRTIKYVKIVDAFAHLETIYSTDGPYL
jgi:hypothetical protein